MAPLTGSPVRALGEILIDPPIQAADLNDCEFLQKAGQIYMYDVRLVVVEEPVETTEGTLLRRQAIAVAPAMGVSKGRALLRDLQRIVDEYGDGRTFTGRLNLTCLDEETQSRVKIIDGTAVQFHPTWPGESE